MPETPAPLSPEEGAEIDDPSVAFEWSGVDDATNYELQLASTADFEDPVFEGRVGDTTTFTYGGLPAQEGVELHWRVRARVDGEWMDYGDVASFAVSDWQPAQPQVAQAQTDDPAPAAEATESNAAPILMAGVVLITGLAIGVLYLAPGTSTPASPTSTASPPAPDTSDVELRRYEVLDEEAGVYRIPIDSAMKQVVQSRGGEWNDGP